MLSAMRTLVHEDDNNILRHLDKCENMMVVVIVIVVVVVLVVVVVGVLAVVVTVGEVRVLSPPTPNSQDVMCPHDMCLSPSPSLLLCPAV